VIIVLDARKLVLLCTYPHKIPLTPPLSRQGRGSYTVTPPQADGVFEKHNKAIYNSLPPDAGNTEEDNLFPAAGLVK